MSEQEVTSTTSESEVTFKTFCADFIEEANKRDLFDGIEAAVESWVELIKSNYKWNHYHDMWCDEDRVFEKLIAICNILENEIDGLRYIDLSFLWNG